MGYKRWRIFLVLILALAVFGAYFKVLKAEFVYDDIGFIVNNKDIQSFKPFSKFFLSPDIFTGSNYAAENVGGKNWRPIASLAFALEYALFGANPYGFHLVSLLLHLLNLILVYLLVIKLTKRVGIAALVTGFWALHPTLTEAVSWVTSQSSLIFIGFFILAVLALINYQENKAMPAGRQDKKFFLWFSYLFFALSLLSKETALGGVFIIPFIFYFYPIPRIEESAPPWRGGGRILGINRIFINSLPFALIGLSYFYARYKILGALGDHALRGSFLENLLLAPAVFYKYLSLAFYPVKLLLNYANFPLPLSVGDPRVALGILSVIFLAALFYLGLKKSWFNFSFGIVWFLAFLLPVMQIIPFHDIVGERFLYAPLIGFFFFIIIGFDKLLTYFKSEYDWNLHLAVKIIAILVLIWFFILTFNRNNDWLSDENLWNSVLRIDPKNEKALNNLAAYYVNAGQAKRVIELSEKLLQINPEDISGNLNLGAGFAMAGRLEEARSKFLYVLSKKPDYQPALVYLAVFYQSIGNYDKALEIVKNLNVRYPDKEDIKQRLLQLQNIMKYGKFSSNVNTNGQYPYIEAELQAPAVEGNIVNSGIFGKVLLNGMPFEAGLDVFRSDDMSKPFISVRSDAQGMIQIPLKPALYIIKPNSPYSSHVSLKDQYTVAVGNGRWLQVKIEYK